MTRIAVILTLLAALTLIPSTYAVADESNAQSHQSAMCAKGSNSQAICLKKASITLFSGGGSAFQSGIGGDTVVYDRCPPGSDKFCPAGAYCCQNAAGEYRCCK